MVNTSLNWVSIVGIVLMVGGALLFSLRTYKPALSRDTDVFFAAVGLLCGGILFFQGWRLDPILQFSQFLLATTTIFFVYESVRLRGVTAEQARRSEFMDDPEGTEPRSRIAPIGSGLDEWDTLERRAPMRRPALEAADWDQQPPRPIRRAPEEEPPWRDAPPPLPPRRSWDRDVPQSPRASGERPTRRGRDPMAAPSLRPRRPERTAGPELSPRARLEPSREGFSSREDRSLIGQAINPVTRRRMVRRQRSPAVRPEPFDQDPGLKLARSAPHASRPPQGTPLNRNRNTTPPSGAAGARDYTAPAGDPKPRLDPEQDNSGRFDN